MNCNLQLLSTYYYLWIGDLYYVVTVFTTILRELTFIFNFSISADINRTICTNCITKESGQIPGFFFFRSRSQAPKHLTLLCQRRLIILDMTSSLHETICKVSLSLEGGSRKNSRLLKLSIQFLTKHKPVFIWFTGAAEREGLGGLQPPHFFPEFLLCQ